MNRKLEQLEKRYAEQVGAEFCRHGGFVQAIEADPDGQWEHKKKPPSPCGQCGLFSPVGLTIILTPERPEEAQNGH